MERSVQNKYIFLNVNDRSSLKAPQWEILTPNKFCYVYYLRLVKIA